MKAYGIDALVSILQIRELKHRQVLTQMGKGLVGLSLHTPLRPLPGPYTD